MGEGSHTLTVTYEEIETTVIINVVDLDAIDTQINNLFTHMYNELNKMDDTLSSYDEWFTSLEEPTKLMGKNIEISVINGEIVWQYSGEEETTNIIAQTTITQAYYLFSNEAFELYKMNNASYQGTFEEWLKESLNIEFPDFKTVNTTFLYNDGVSPNSHTISLQNTKLTEPELDYIPGYNFVGWKTESGEYWDFEDNATSNMILTANYEPKEYTLTLLDEFLEVDPVTVTVHFGDQVTLNNKDNVPPYKFIGWFTATDMQITSGLWNLDDDLTIYAIYELDCEASPFSPECINNPDPNMINVLDTLPTDAIEISFWHIYGSSKGALLDEMIDEFEALYPNITVNASSQGSYNNLKSKYIAAIAAGLAPTMTVGYTDHFMSYLEGDAIIPLDDFITHDTWGIDINDIIPSYMNENSQYPGGYYYSMPYSKSTEFMIYNKTLFDANGITIPSDTPITWDMLDTYASTMVGTGANQCEYLVNYDSGANLFITSSKMWDAPYTNDMGDILINNDTTKAMLSAIQTRFNDNTMTLPTVWNESYGSTNFINQDVCMQVGSTAGVYYNIPYDGEFEVGIAPIPQYDLDNKAVIQQGPNIGISSNTTDAERLAAWLLYTFLTNPENTAQWAMFTGYLPISYAGYETSAYQDYLNITDPLSDLYYSSLTSKVAYTQLDYMFYDTTFVGPVTSGDARNQTQTLMNNIIYGYTIEEVINDMLIQLNAN